MCGLLAWLLLAPANAQARVWPIPPAWWLYEAACIHKFEVGLGAYPATYAWPLRWHDTDNPSSRGGLQIEWGTWERRGVGGHGDPAAASMGEQLYRAWLIYEQDGGSWREWTTASLCGFEPSA